MNSASSSCSSVSFIQANARFDPRRLVAGDADRALLALAASLPAEPSICLRAAACLPLPAPVRTSATNGTHDDSYRGAHVL